VCAIDRNGTDEINAHSKPTKTGILYINPHRKESRLEV